MEEFCRMHRQRQLATCRRAGAMACYDSYVGEESVDFIAENSQFIGRTGVIDKMQTAYESMDMRFAGETTA